MNGLFRLIAATTLVLGALLNTSCSSTAKFKATSSAISFNRNLPPHDDCLPGSLELRVFADMLDDDEFKQALGASLRQKAGDTFVASSRTAAEQGKKPQYIINITQMTEDSKFDGNEEAAIYGAIFGGAGGAVAGGSGRRLAGGGIGAAAGGAGAWALFGEKQRAFHFLINIQQMTSTEGREQLATNKEGGVSSETGSRDEQVGTIVGAGENAVVKSGSRFDVADNYYKQVGSFMIACEGGSFSNEDKAIAAAKQAIVDKLPGFLTGGSLIDF